MVVERHSSAIRQYIAARIGPAACEDVTAETFAVAWRSRSGFRPSADTARPWLYGIATKLLQQHRADEARWQKGIRTLAGADAPALIEMCDMFPRLDMELVRAISKLSRGEREVLVLVALGEMTVAEAARATRISTVAARVRLHRARKSMVRYLDSDSKETI